MEPKSESSQKQSRHTMVQIQSSHEQNGTQSVPYDERSREIIVWHIETAYFNRFYLNGSNNNHANSKSSYLMKLSNDEGHALAKCNH